MKDIDTIAWPCFTTYNFCPCHVIEVRDSFRFVKDVILFDDSVQQ